MHNRSVLKIHAALVDQMAETLGVDLEEATLRGDVLIDEISDAALKCSACSHAESCQDWMKGRKDGATHSSDYCRNSAMFQRLRQATER